MFLSKSKLIRAIVLNDYNIYLHSVRSSFWELYYNGYDLLLFICFCWFDSAGQSSNDRVVKRKVRVSERHPNGGVIYPLDIWFLIGNHIRPEDVASFSAICHGSHRVVHLARFWSSLYKRWVVDHVLDFCLTRVVLQISCSKWGSLVTAYCICHGLYFVTCVESLCRECTVI